jgi:hypothetical protein
VAVVVTTAHNELGFQVVLAVAVVAIHHHTQVVLEQLIKVMPVVLQELQHITQAVAVVVQVQ